ncbi:MAG: S26 family signal peptidase [Syntrophorhabdus aromaticivorans]|uniref:S26 family signal peptidase n=1 Tax=Syntrophorhabdus aromaticivorans TaxID=328301 RepID=A0A971M6U1_9BACT|nr:S26 family signal peptidase [Syntrophorhabdus aromaticivorans]
MTSLVSKRQRSILFTMTAGVVLLLLSFPMSKLQKHYYLNLSPSVPLGLYRMSPPATLGVGDLVVFDPPPRVQAYIYGRRWLPQGWPLIKYVGALPGDTYSVKDVSLYINNRYMGPVYDQDNEGNRPPRITGIRTVEPGTFLPLSTHITHSFDGRYFGTVELASIKGKALPVWTY